MQLYILFGVPLVSFILALIVFWYVRDTLKSIREAAALAAYRVDEAFNKRCERMYEQLDEMRQRLEEYDKMLKREAQYSRWLNDDIDELRRELAPQLEKSPTYNRPSPPEKFKPWPPIRNELSRAEGAIGEQED